MIKGDGEHVHTDVYVHCCGLHYAFNTRCHVCKSINTVGVRQTECLTQQGLSCLEAKAFGWSRQQNSDRAGLLGRTGEMWQHELGVCQL